MDCETHDSLRILCPTDNNSDPKAPRHQCLNELDGVELECRSEKLQTKTTIRSLSEFERVNQRLFRLIDGEEPSRLKQSEFPWKRIFATGYGSGVRVHGTEDYDSYLAVDALYPLFVYDKPLQNPELVIRRLVASRGEENGSVKILDALKGLLWRILKLESSDSIQLTETGIKVKNSQGLYPLSSSGDGYHSTVPQWVLDEISSVSMSFPGRAHHLTDIDGISHS